MKSYYLAILMVFGILWACRNDDNTAQLPIDQPYHLALPSHFPAVQYALKDNPPTQYGVALGKKLFYDGRLAKDNAVACAFCHIQENAFTHHGHSVSHGVEGREGIRNAPPIQNMIFLKRYMWDGSVTQLDMQPIIPISTHEEMDETIENIIIKIKDDTEYQRLFSIVYGDKNITAERILKSITQFMATLISANSKYDRVIRHESEFTPEEAQGYAVFQNKCASCHTTALFTDESFRNTGIPYNPITQDEGRKRVTGKAEDFLKFRVPSLRNVAYTAPYTHDGRFYTLKALLDFYDSGMEDQPNLDPEFRKYPGRVGIRLSEAEKQQLIKFLNTLSDPQFISNPNFSE
ncbi:cytochrome-c peroxidase [Riemerella columbina]|uniref:cytochrome-c peroxidase n=1 Tax=Riemerella columbina TaxID=103810 RepID=UPI002670961B|nr:cytochrome c peroxidase [Riemerella columbina]WKS95742.1 c-type cytochrome [Riemerella columbina]